MLPWILAAVVILPIAEIAIFFEIGSRLGLWPTIGAVLATAIFGSILVRRQGMAIFRQVQNEVRAGCLPALQIFDGLSLLIAGALLLAPGFITDAAGCLFLIPLIRHFFINSIVSFVQVRISAINSAVSQPREQTIEGEFADVTEHRSSP
tara:strand:- start:412 stop:861 length:450 start_codon:yes stop_codon:yes gene_type:complete